MLMYQLVSQLVWSWKVDITSQATSTTEWLEVSTLLEETSPVLTSLAS